MKIYFFIGGMLNGIRCYTKGQKVISVDDILPRLHAKYVYILQRWREGDCITEFYAKNSLSRKETDTLVRKFFQ